LGRRPLGAILHSSNEPGELSQWLCHDDSTINSVVLIIVIIIITGKQTDSWAMCWWVILASVFVIIAVLDVSYRR